MRPRMRRRLELVDFQSQRDSHGISGRRTRSKVWKGLGKTRKVCLCESPGYPYELVWLTQPQELHLYELSIKAWQEALGTLPSEEPSDQDTQLRSQYEEGLRKSQEGLEAHQSRTMESDRLQAIPSDVKLPWVIALEMEDILTANNVLNSCVGTKCHIPRSVSRVDVRRGPL